MMAYGFVYGLVELKLSTRSECKFTFGWKGKYRREEFFQPKLLEMLEKLPRRFNLINGHLMGRESWLF